MNKFYRHETVAAYLKEAAHLFNQGKQVLIEVFKFLLGLVHLPIRATQTHQDIEEQPSKSIVLTLYQHKPPTYWRFGSLFGRVFQMKFFRPQSFALGLLILLGVLQNAYAQTNLLNGSGQHSETVDGTAAVLFTVPLSTNAPNCTGQVSITFSYGLQNGNNNNAGCCGGNSSREMELSLLVNGTTYWVARSPNDDNTVTGIGGTPANHQATGGATCTGCVASTYNMLGANQTLATNQTITVTLPSGVLLSSANSVQFKFNNFRIAGNAPYDNAIVNVTNVSMPTCPAPPITLCGKTVYQTGSGGFSTAALAVANNGVTGSTAFNIAPNTTFTQVATVRSDANGNLGLFNTAQVLAPALVLATCSANTRATRTNTEELYLKNTGTGACVGSAIPKSRDGANSSTFNPEWIGLTPNTDYLIFFTTTVDPLCTNFNLSSVSYYGFTIANAAFTFNCGTASTTGTFTANGTGGQTGTLTVPITGATAGAATFNVSGTGFTGTLSTILTAGQTSVVVPITYDGSGAAGSRTLTITSSQGTGTCTKAVNVIGPLYPPGCVSNGITSWFKADALTGADGSSVSSWADASAAGYNITQPTAAYQPKLYNATKLINFNPTVDFDGVDDHIRNLTPLMSSTTPYTFLGVNTDEAADLGYRAFFSSEQFVDHFILYKQNGAPLDNGWTPYAIGGLLSDRGTFGKGTKYSIAGGSNGFWNGTNFTSNATTDIIQPSVVGMSGDNVLGTASRANFFTWADGYKGNPGNWSPTDEGSSLYQSYLFKAFAIGADMSQAGAAFEFWKGRVPEIVTYNRQLTDAEMAKVNTYFAIKYGITLGQGNGSVGVNGNNYNYVRGDGTVIWDATANSTYNATIAGIGQDACQGLFQKQSKSIRPDEILTISGGTAISTTNANNNATSTNIPDKAFMVWGSNGQSTSFGVVYAPTSYTPVGGYFRMNRVWKVQETGTVGAVVLNVPAGKHLLVSNDPTFATGVTEVPLTSGTASYDFTNGQYFTFGQEVFAPGCVAGGNVRVWLKADAGITAADGAGVATWTDQSLFGYNVTQPTATYQPKYYNSNASKLINFNPTLEFDGVDNYMRNLTPLMPSTSPYTFMGVNTDEAADLGYRAFFSSEQFWDHFILYKQNGAPLDNGWTPYAIGGLLSDRGTFGKGTKYSIAGGSNGFYNGTNFTSNATTDIIRPSIVGVSGDNVLGTASRANYFTWADGYKGNPGNWSPTDEGNATYQSYLFKAFAVGSDMGVNDVRAEQWKGRIPEIIAYDRQLTDPEMAKVNTYFAIKYGITLGQGNGSVGVNGNNYNYVRGDGTVIWDGTGNSTYKSDIFGIGRDDCQQLNQKQSTSVQDNFVTIGNGTGIAATNVANTNAFGTDKSFDVFGSNGLAKSYSIAYAPTSYTPSGSYNRMARVWKVQETGTVGSVTVSAQSGMHLLVSNDPTFATGVTEVALTNGTASFDFTNGQYFTFGLETLAPGCVVNGLNLWIKADASGITSGTSAVKDNSPVGQDIPKIGTTNLLQAADAAHNYNPYLSGFSSTEFFKNLNSPMAPQNAFQASEVTMIAAVRPTSAGTGRIVGIDNDDNFASEPDLSINAGKPSYYRYWISTQYITHPTAATVNESSIFSARTNGTTASIGLNGNFNNQTITAGGGLWGDILTLGYGTWASAGAFPGDIEEVIWYKSSLSDPEVQKIHSYLAVKYGTTLGMDYLSGAGTKIWDKTANATFHNNVFGIGRDNCQALHQKQSKSTTANGKMTIGVDNQIATTNAANTGALDNNATFLMVGDNGATGVTTIAPGSACTPPGPDKSTNKIWKFVETGTVESVKVSTNLSPDFTSTSTQVFMQVATDAAFTNVVANIPANYNATASAFETNYDFTGTQYVRYVGVQTPPANLCIGGDKTLNWLSFAPFDWWSWGTDSKTYNLGNGQSAVVNVGTGASLTKNAAPILYEPIVDWYPVNYGNYLYIPRYDNTPNTAVVTRIELVNTSNTATPQPASKVSFKIKDIDGWVWGKDVVKVYGKLGGTSGVVVNPVLSTNKLFTNITLAGAPTNTGTGSIWPWDWTVLGDMYVNFESPIDVIYIEHTKVDALLPNIAKFNDIAIGAIDITCQEPTPEVATPDNVYLFKTVSPNPSRVGEAFTYKFKFQNFNCTAQTVNLNDVLPAGITWKDSTLATSLTVGTQNNYGGSGTLTLGNISVPVGTSYIYVEAVASQTGTLNNQATFTVNGHTYNSDNPATATGTPDPTPITIIAGPATADLTITKAVDKSSMPQGNTVEYTYTIKNNGATTTTTQLSDMLQGDATYVASTLTYTPTPSGTPLPNTYANTGTLDIRDLQVNAGQTLTIKIKAKAVSNPVVGDTLKNFFTVKTGLGTDAQNYTYKEFKSNQVITVIQSLPSVAGTVFNDGGAGGGTPGNCIKDGTEGATGLPVGLYAKLIQGGVALQAVAVSSGAFSFPNVTDGSYTIILDDNATLSDITSTLPSGWTGTSSWTGTSAGGTLSPALKFCISNVPPQVIIAAVSGTVFNDNGTGGGTANNCTKDGGESAAGIPSGLYTKLIQGGVVVNVAAIDINGGFIMNNVTVGTGYTMIVDNNNSYTDAISNVPANWTVNTWTGDVIVTSPFTNPVLKFCMYYSLPTSTVTAPANTVFNDNGTGGGTAGNCTMDGGESATGLPTLYAKLIQSGSVVQVATVTNGGFSFTGVPDGSYSIILDDNNSNTDVTSNLPAGWIGTATWAGTITGGVASPALKFCIYNPPSGPCAGSTSSVGAAFATTNVLSGGEISTFSSVNFSSPASGILSTDRAGTSGFGYFSFAGAAMPLNASSANFVDGYVRKYGGSNFTFPIGDNGSYRPAIVNWSAACPSVIEAAYYGVDPTTAVTSKVVGSGNWPTAPTGGPFPTTSRSSNLFSVSNIEYWDINGTPAADITLTWNGSSNITALATSNLNNLSIAGWNPTTSKWEQIPSTVVAGSTLASGSIKTNAPIVPNTYNVYTFAGAVVPNITTVKTAPATITQFVPFDYTFTIKNTSSTIPTTGNIVVRDTLKGGLQYVSYGGPWTCAFLGTAGGNDVVECTLTGTLNPGVSTSATIKVNPTLGGTISNTSYTSGGGMTGGPFKSSTSEGSAGTPQNPTAGSPTISTVTPIPNLVTTKVAPATAIQQGVKFDYTLTVTNTGSVATSGTITVRDTLKNGLKYVGFTGSNWTCSKTGVDLSGNDIVVCTSTTPIAANSGTSGILLTVLPTQATNISNMTWTSGGGMPGGPYKSGPTTATAGSVQNPTSGTPTGGPGAVPGTTPVTARPILVTTKTTPGTAIVQNQNFDYTFTLTNNGAANTDGVTPIVVTDTLRNGLIYVSGNGAGWSCATRAQNDPSGNQIVDCSTTNVINANGDTEILTLTVKPTQATNTNNMAWVSGGGMPGGPYPTGPTSTTAGNALNPTPITPTPTPQTIGAIPSVVTVKRTNTTTVDQFTPFDYTFDLENKGSAATSGTLTVRDTLRNGLKYVSMVAGSPAWTCSLMGQDLTGNDIVQCVTTTPIPAFNTLTLIGGTSSFTIRVKPTLPGPVSNIAWVNGGGMPGGPYKTGASQATAGSPSNPTAGSPTGGTTVAPVPILKTAKVAPAVPVQQFVPFSYSFTVMNDGGAATSGTISIKDTLRNGLKFVSGPSSGAWTCSVLGTLVTGEEVVECISTTPIAANTTAPSFSMSVKATQGGSVNNVAFVSGGSMPGGPYKTAPTTTNSGNPTNPTGGASSPATITPVPNLSTTKTAPTASVTQYVPFDYTITVSNSGGAASAGTITVRDTLKNGLKYNGFTGTNWTCAKTGVDVYGNDIVVCTYSNAIPVSGSSSFTLNVNPTQVASLNNATWTNGGGMPGGPYKSAPSPANAGNLNNPTGGGNTGATSVTPVPDLKTAKIIGTGPFQQNQPFTYTFQVTNGGSVATTGLITITDTLRNGLKFVTGGNTDWTCSKTGVDGSGNDIVTCTSTLPVASSNTTSFPLQVNPTMASNSSNVAWTSGGGMPGGPYKSGTTNTNAAGPSTPTAGTPTAPTPISPGLPDVILLIAQPSPVLTEGLQSTGQVTVTNQGNGTATGAITVNLTLPTELSAPASFTSGTWSCTTAGVNITCTSPNTAGIPINTSAQFDVPVTPSVGSVGKTLIISGQIPPITNEGVTTNNNASMTTNTPVQTGTRPDLQTTIGTIPTLNEGITSNIPVTIKNIGNGNATGALTFSTNLPNGLTAPGTFTDGGWTCNTTGQTVSCTNPNASALAPNASLPFNIPVTPAVGTVGATPTITGSVNQVLNEIILTNNTGSATAATAIQPANRPDLQTVIGQPTTPLTEGAASNIPVTINNIGTAPATGTLTFSTNLPNGLTAPLTFVDGGWTCNTSGQTVSCTNPNASGLPATTGTTTFNIPVTPSVGTAGQSPAISGSVSPVTYETATTNNTGSMTPNTAIAPMARPDLITTIGQPSPALTEGLTSNIPVTITNQGNAPATGQLTFTTTLPNGLSAPATFTNGGWTCNTSGQTVTCTNPNTSGLAASGNTAFNIPITPASGTAGTTPTITGTTSPVPNETATTNNTGSMTPTAAISSMARPDIVTTIGQPSPALVENQTSNIPVTLTNIGNAPATGPLTFSTTLPNGLSAPATFTNGGWTCTTSGQTVSCNNPNNAGLPDTPGSNSTTFNIPVTPLVGTAGQTPAISGATATVPNETNTANNTGNMTPATPIAPMPRPDIVTTIGQPSPAYTEGVTSNVPVTLTNVGTAPATGQLTFTTTLPNGLTAPATFTNGGWTCNTSGQTVTCTNPNNTGLPATTGSNSTTFNIPVTPAIGTSGTSPAITGTTSPVPNETNTGNNTTSMTPTTPIATGARPDLTTTVGQPSPALVEGQTSNIPVTIANVGTAPATGTLTFSTTLPNGLTAPASFTNGGWTCSTSSQTVTCTNPNNTGLPFTVGSNSTTFNIPITPATGTAGTSPSIGGSTNTVPNEVNTGNNTATPITVTTPIAAAPKPDLTTSIGQPSPAYTEGVTSNVPVTITNIGTGPATGPLTFTTTLPNGLTTPASFTNNGWTCSTSGQTVTCTNPNTTGLPATTGSNSTTFNLPVTPATGTAGTSPSITGKIDPVPGETNTTNNTSPPMTPNVPIAATAKPDIALSFGTPSPALAVGQQSNVPVTITNIGTANATGQLVFSMTIPNNLTSPASYNGGNGWSCSTSGATLTCLNPNASGLPFTSGSNSSTFNIQLTPIAGSTGQQPIVSGSVNTVPSETATANNSALALLPAILAAPASGVSVTLKALLQGSYQSAGLMRDQLRSGNLIPTTEPYTGLGYTHTGGGGGETVSSTILANTDINNAIVDWVIVELRSDTTSTTPIASKAALIQKDGDIVSATDGVSPVNFATVTPGNYYVAVKHRNHLGAMTKNAYNFASTVGLIDFTNATTATKGIHAQRTLSDGRKALWAGNTSGDKRVIYSGGSNDVNPIFSLLMNDPANTSKSLSFFKVIYNRSDVNMNGTVIYQGGSNDVDLILANILAHPGNTGKSASYVIFEQIP